MPPHALCYEESLAIRRELGDKRGIAISLNNLGIVAYLARGTMPPHALCMRRALLYSGRVGETSGASPCRSTTWGLWPSSRETMPPPAPCMRRALLYWRELGDKWGIANSLAGLGGVAGRYRPDAEGGGGAWGCGGAVGEHRRCAR